MNNHFTRLDNKLIFIFCILIFTFLTQYVTTDIQRHILSIERINMGKSHYSPNFLFSFTVNLFSGFSNNLSSLYSAAIIILSLATTGKYIISKIIIADLSKTLNNKYSNKNLSLIALVLFFCFAIPDFYNIFILKWFYLGRIVPTVWHNSTTIFLFPFAILLFCKQLKVFNRTTIFLFRDIVIINCLVVINILIKPSFIFVFIPGTFFMLLPSFRSDNFQRIMLKLTPILTGGVLSISQYILIYQIDYFSSIFGQNGIRISAPFEYFAHYYPRWYIPISFILSLALPLFSMIAYREIFKYPPFVYSLYLTIAGILISVFIIETGPRMWHGNFTWQNIICTYLLMLTTITFLIPKFISRKRNLKTTTFLIVVLGLHSLSGILYLIKIAITLSYY